MGMGSTPNLTAAPPAKEKRDHSIAFMAWLAIFCWGAYLLHGAFDDSAEERACRQQVYTSCFTQLGEHVACANNAAAVCE